MHPRESAQQVQKTGLDIGFLCAGWPPDIGGVESHTQDLARALRARGHRIHVFCLDSSSKHEPFTTRTQAVDGVEVRRLAYAYGDHDRLAAVVVNSKAEDAVHGWLAETPCDVVHVHHLTGFGMGALRALSDIGAPCLMTLHDYWPLCPRGQMLSAQGEVCERPEPDVCASCLSATWAHLMPSGTGLSTGPRNEQLEDDRMAAAKRTEFALEMLGLPNRLVTPSQAALEVYARAGVPRESMVVCGNGIETSELAAAVERERASRVDSETEHVTLGILGTVLPSKGVLELARTFAAANIDGLKLEIHGNMPTYHGDDSYLTELRLLSECTANLSIHGPFARAELPKILANLDGVAAPSRWEEVFGLSVREARAAGLPVLVSDAGALPEVLSGVSSSGSSRIVARDDGAAWTQALREFKSGSSEGISHTTEPRSTHDMMLQLEKTYIEIVMESAGTIPDLQYAVEGGDSDSDSPPVGWLAQLIRFVKKPRRR